MTGTLINDDLDERVPLAGFDHDGEENIIEFIKVTKTYGQGSSAFQALRDINFQIASGEFVAVTGPSGSGKSTVMNILGCLDTPTSGSYLFNGMPVEQLSRNQRALLRRHFFGFVFQGFNLLPRTTALENVELPLLYRGMPARARRAAAFQALELVELQDWKTHTPAELSGGQQQRVAIARALVTKPEVLFADEPTGNLDSQRTREILELITSLNRRHHITVLIVTHEPDVAAYADRTIHIVDGWVDSDSGNKKVLA
jgi:putative ABC transport system ATP-binding protein